MIHPRDGHCMAAIGSKLIFVIGSRLYKPSKTCEVFNIALGVWRECPKLSRNRYISSAVTLCERFVYVLGGYETSVTDIERLDAEPLMKESFGLIGGPPQPTLSWESFQIILHKEEFLNDIKYWFGACAVGSTSILIFGGK